jgi:acyl-coenzyme A thioesterase PaaI-like protein
MVFVPENVISPEGTALRASSVPHSFTSDWGMASLQVTPQRSLIRANLTDKLRTPSGSAALGLLVTVSDVGASFPALVACSPDYTATRDLSLHGAGWVTEGPIVVDSRLLRIGSKTVHVSADVYDARGVTDLAEFAGLVDRGGPAPAARGLVTFARLPGSAGGADQQHPEGWAGVLREQPVAPVEGTIYSRLGLRVLDPAAGMLELDRTPFVTNRIGTIQGGAQVLLAESAALAMRPGLVAADAQAHYLSQLRVGPARSYGTVIRDAPDHSVVAVRLVDAGAGDQLLTLTTILLRRPPAIGD